jgi:hypothetical protein
MHLISIKSLLRSLGILFLGLLISYIILGVSEFYKVTSIGLGTRYWANWLYPFYLLLGFLLSALCFRSTKRTYVVIFCGFVVFFLIFIFLSQGQIFDNWKPFGVDAY